MEVTRKTNIEFADKFKVYREAISGNVSGYNRSTVLQCSNKIHQHLGHYMEIYTKNPDEIYEFLINTKIVSTSVRRDMVFFAIKDHKTLVEHLQSCINMYNKTKKSTMRQEFLSKYDIEWRNMVISKLEKTFFAQSQQKSKEPKEAVRQRVTQCIHFFTFIEKHILEKYKDRPEHIDPIRWFLNLCNQDTAKELLLLYGHAIDTSTRDVPIRASHPVHPARTRIARGLALLKKYLKEYIPSDIGYLTTESLLAEVNLPMRESTTRNYFNKQEIELLYKACEGNSRDTLMLCILHEVALRVGAIACLKISDVLSTDGNPRDSCNVLEKGRKYRQFMTSQKLRDCIQNYLTDFPDIKKCNLFLFPKIVGSIARMDEHIHQSTFSTRLSAIAKKAEVNGPHVHPHAFRHTLVDNLMSEGNTIANVSKFIGHSNVSTTERYYWTSSIETIIETMNVPWLSLKNIKEVAVSLKSEKSDSSGSIKSLENLALLKVLMVTLKILTQEQKEELKRHIPNIDDILASICDVYDTISTIHSSVSSRIASAHESDVEDPSE
jgi:site-specific recombinase XerD